MSSCPSSRAPPGGELTSTAIRTFLKAGDRTLVSTDVGHGITVKICSLDALKAMKGASERARDRDDLAALDALEERD